MTTVYIDGQWYTRETAKISVFDHGLLYGDGVFEGMRVYGGKVFRFKEHLDRLYDSSKAIHLAVPISKAEMTQVTEEGIRRGQLSEGYLRHLVTRGVGDLGLDPRKCPVGSVIVIFDIIQLWPEERYEQGLDVITAGTPIPHREALSPRVKSLNYLPHIMAKVEGIVAGKDEILMLDSSGYVCEASGQNVFIWRRNELLTPPAYAGILEGVTRNAIMEIARGAGLTVREQMLNRYDVYTADEAFFCGTATEIAPIRSLDGRIIGEGKAGPRTKDLLARFRKLTRS